MTDIGDLESMLEAQQEIIDQQQEMIDKLAEAVKINSNTLKTIARRSDSE